MALFDKLKGVLESAGLVKKVKTTKSLKKILETIDFNVYRYRKKTGNTITGKRGGKHEQKQLQDCSKIDLPGGYKLFALNIQQFLQKVNGEYPELINGQLANIRSKSNFDIPEMPNDIKKDLGISFNKGGDYNYNSKKEGYIAFLLQGKNLIPLRRKDLAENNLKGSSSKKSIYREKRDGSLEDSFIKQVGLLISQLVKDKNGNSLLELDIKPEDYVPKRENKDDKEVVEIKKKDKLNLDLVEENNNLTPIQKKIEKVLGVEYEVLNEKLESFGIDIEDIEDVKVFPLGFELFYDKEKEERIAISKDLENLLFLGRRAYISYEEDGANIVKSVDGVYYVYEEDGITLDNKFTQEFRQMVRTKSRGDYNRIINNPKN